MCCTILGGRVLASLMKLVNTFWDLSTVHLRVVKKKKKQLCCLATRNEPGDGKSVSGESSKNREAEAHTECNSGSCERTSHASYEIDKISEVVDFLNLLTFDFHGSWQKVTGHVSPFLQGKEDSKSSSYYNVDYAVRYWRNKGAPAEKLIMGIPTYGRSFTLSSSKTGIGTPFSGPGSPGPFTQEAGLLACYEICTFTPDATTERTLEQEVPYSYKGNQWVGYDDEQSITTKVQYLKNNKLEGAMIWAVDLDDFDGLFCSQKKPYPLTGTVKAKPSSGN